MEIKNLMEGRGSGHPFATGEVVLQLGLDEKRKRGTTVLRQGTLCGICRAAVGESAPVCYQEKFGHTRVQVDGAFVTPDRRVSGYGKPKESMGNCLIARAYAAGVFEGGVVVSNLQPEDSQALMLITG